jgi:hypothetical protein
MPPPDSHARHETPDIPGFNLLPTVGSARTLLDAADCRYGLLPGYIFIITLTEDEQSADLQSLP